MWRSSQFRLVGVVLAIPCAALFGGVGTARAASLTVDPVAVVEGGNLIVSGEEWIGDVAIVFVKGNTAIQAGSAPSGPNGGPISITVVAPPSRERGRCALRAPIVWTCNLCRCALRSM